LTRYYNASAGVVISASHNPYYDNGIKFFDEQGFKLTDATEDNIQKRMSETSESPTALNEKIGTCSYSDRAKEIYLDYLFKMIRPQQLTGLKVIMDCANGANYVTAPEAFEKTGAQVIVINASPDGCNINHKCGSTHLEALQKQVVCEQADFGIAFDGDGDRLMAIDKEGNIVNGDMLMLLFAKYLKKKNALSKNTVIITTMSNMGLLKALESNGIAYDQTDVGDRYILQKLLSGGYNFGGEQSGHIILFDINTTGDGLASALMLAKIIKETDLNLGELTRDFVNYPQILVNVKVETQNKLCYKESREVAEAVDKLNRSYQGNGRILLRHSGTEPLVRIMIEGKDQRAIENDAHFLAAIIEKIQNKKSRQAFLFFMRISFILITEYLNAMIKAMINITMISCHNAL
jgi:phosphoglucosamine mutase